MTKPRHDAVKVGPLRVAPFVRDGAPTGRWLIDLPPHVSPSGKRARVFFETKTAATTEAKRLLRELQLDGAIRGYGPKLAGITFEEAAKRWLAEQMDRVATGKKRPSSVETDAYWLKPILAVLKDRDVAKILAPEVIQYQKDRLGAGCKPTTVNSEVALIRRVLLWAQARDLLERVPKVETIPVPKRRVKLPTIDEMARILGALPSRKALLVRFLAETGCRKSEAFALEWPDLDAENLTVAIRRKAHFTPKTANSDRDIPISASLMADLQSSRREALKAAMEAATKAARRTAMKAGKKARRTSAARETIHPAPASPPYVFPGRGGAKMTDFDKALAAAIKSAGVVRDGQPMHLTPHMLRKAHATWLKARGVDDSLLQPRLGHTPGSRITASTYVHVTTEAERGAVLDLAAERAKRPATFTSATQSAATPAAAATP